MATKTAIFGGDFGKKWLLVRSAAPSILTHILEQMRKFRFDTDIFIKDMHKSIELKRQFLIFKKSLQNTNRYKYLFQG